MAAFDRPWSSKCLSSTSRSHPYTGASTSRGRRNVGVGPGNQLPGPDQRPSVQFQPAILCNLKPVMTSAEKLGHEPVPGGVPRPSRRTAFELLGRSLLPVREELAIHVECKACTCMAKPFRDYF